MTSRSEAGESLKKESASATAWPERFMKVRGLRRRHRWPASSASMSEDWKRDFGMEEAGERRSMSMKPALWRVLAYWEPGLPRPTMSFWDVGGTRSGV